MVRGRGNRWLDAVRKKKEEERGVTLGDRMRVRGRPLFSFPCSCLYEYHLGNQSTFDEGIKQSDMSDFVFQEIKIPLYWTVVFRFHAVRALEYNGTQVKTKKRSQKKHQPRSSGYWKDFATQRTMGQPLAQYVTVRISSVEFLRVLKGFATQRTMGQPQYVTVCKDFNIRWGNHCMTFEMGVVDI